MESTVLGPNDRVVELSQGELQSIPSVGVTPEAQPLEFGQPADGDLWDATVAATKRYSVYALARYGMVRSGLSSEPDYRKEYFDPFKNLDPKYEPYADILAEANNQFDADLIKTYSDEIAQEKVVANSNMWGNLAGTLVASVFSPITLAGPAAAAITAPRAVFGGGVTQRIVGEAVAGAVLDVPFEAALMWTDPAFHLDEAWTGVALSALAGGALGGLAPLFHSSGPDVAPKLRLEALHGMVQPIEDSLTLPGAPRMTKPSATTPENYAQRMADEGFLAGDGVFSKLTKPVFDFFTSGKGTNYQPSVAARLLSSPSLSTREITNNLIEHNFLLGKHKQGDFSQPVEAIVNAEVFKNEGFLEAALDAGYVSYKKNGGTLGRSDFEAEVAKAVRKGTHDNSAVATAANSWRQMTKQYHDRFIKAGVWGEGTGPKSSETYFTRSYDRDMIDEYRADWEKTIAEHIKKEGGFGDTADELAKVSDQVKKITSDILSKKQFDMEHVEWRDANLKTRTLDIPDDVLEPFLKNDIRRIGKQYIRKAEIDLALREKFGTTSKQALLDKISDDYKKLIADGGNAENLNMRATQDAEAISTLFDRLTGTRGIPADPASFGVKVVKGLLPYNTARMLGSIALTQLPELGRSMLQRLGQLGFERELKSMGVAIDKIQLSAHELKELGVQLEHGMRLIQTMGDGHMDPFAVKKDGFVVTGLNMAAEALTKLSGMSTMDNFSRSMLANTANRRFYGLAKAVAEGKATSKMLREYAYYGFDAKQAARHVKNFEKHSEAIDGVNYTEVLDFDADLSRAQRIAIKKYTKSHLIETGAADRFLFADSSPLARVLMQFRTYMQGAWSRMLLPGLQGGQVGFLGTVVTLVGIGYLVAHIKASLGNYDTKDRNMFLEAVNQSGAVPFMFDMASLTSQTLGAGGLTQGQRARGKVENLLGPSASLVTASIPALINLANGQGSAADLRAAKSMIPFNNIVFWNWYLTRLVKEKGDELNKK